MKNFKYLIKNLNNRIFQIGILSNGQFFGEEDIFLKQNRSYTAKCISSTAKVYELSK